MCQNYYLFNKDTCSMNCRILWKHIYQFEIFNILCIKLMSDEFILLKIIYIIQ